MSILTQKSTNFADFLENLALAKLVGQSKIARYETAPIQDAALDLYEIGYNVFPQPYGKKGGFPWKAFQYTRLDYGLLKHVFAGQVNMAVMPGKTSNNLFVIDCETETRFLHTIDQLKRRDMDVWAYRTSRGGHIWLHSLDGEVENIKLVDQEIRGKDNYVLCPPSVHPDSSIYYWESQDGEKPPAVHLVDIDWLVDENERSIKLCSRQVNKQPSKSNPRVNSLAVRLGVIDDTRLYQLSNRTLDYLDTGSTLARGDRNDRFFAAACDFSGCEFDAAEARNMLGPIALQSGLPADEISKTLASAYGKLRTPSRSQQRSFSPKPQRWEYVDCYIETHKPTGRNGEKDYLILKALSERARLGANEKGVFRAAERELGGKGTYQPKDCQEVAEPSSKHHSTLDFRSSTRSYQSCKALALQRCGHQ